MPLRNVVPSLKLLSIKRVSWPDGANRKVDVEIEAYPSAEQFCRDKIYSPFIASKLKEDESLNLSRLTTASVNMWIQLSNHYKSPLSEFKSLEPLLQLSPPEVLDFLHEGFSLFRDGDSLEEYEVEDFLRFVIILPQRSMSRPVDVTSWHAVIDTLKTNEMTSRIKELQIKLGPTQEDDLEADEGTHNPHHHDLFLDDYEWEQSFEGFSKLTKLVVRGGTVVDDVFLTAVGEHCYRLSYLDISGCPKVTSDGLFLLCFKDAECEKIYEAQFSSGMEWNLPKELLRPLTRSLSYFDMTVVPGVRNKYRIINVLLMACPQLVGSPTGFLFRPRGHVKVESTHFAHNSTLMPLRQVLVIHARSAFCEELFLFVRSFLSVIGSAAGSGAGSPRFEVRTDEEGVETEFILFHEERVVSYFQLCDLSIVDFTNYSKSSLHFVPLDLLARCAPNLRRLKSSLSGTIDDRFPLLHLHHAAISLTEEWITVKSLLRKCHKLKYLEVREVLLHPRQINDSDLRAAIKGKGAKSLEVLRLLFKTEISILGGLGTLFKHCPCIRMIGDLWYWDDLRERVLYKLHKQVALHNYRLIVEYDGVLYNANESYDANMDLVIS